MMKALTLTQASNRDALKDKMNQVADCIREYEEVSSKPMDEDVKRTLILKIVPTDIREDFQLNGTMKEDYATIKNKFATIMGTFTNH